MMQDQYKKTIEEVGRKLAEAGIPYQFTGEAALFIQGVDAGTECVSVSVQWDVREEAAGLFAGDGLSPSEDSPEEGGIRFRRNGVAVRLYWKYNTTIKTDPYRIAVTAAEDELWCRSLYSYLYDPETEIYSEQIHRFLSGEQSGFTAVNEQAWNQNNYTALVKRYGQPADIAAKIQQNPAWRLYPFHRYMGSLQGKRITHLMGSNGVKAVAMGLLGAEVTVVDFSKENAAYAKETAEAASVRIDYVISDVLSYSAAGQSDLVLMELGVLHYMLDLEALMKKVMELLRPGGTFVLHEFHPVSTKLITSSGKKHKVTGNYFDPSIERNEVAFGKHMDEETKAGLSQVVQRKWTLGEIITSAGAAGLHIKVLEEEPNHKIHDIGLPKTFTFVAEKPGE